MHISKVYLKGFRNFRDTEINLNENCLIIGANDVGKTNFLWALRLLLDKSLPESEIEPKESDFYIDRKSGDQVNEFEIRIEFKNITEDPILSTFKGKVSDEGRTILVYQASKIGLKYKILSGSSTELLDEIQGKFYTKFLHLKYMKSQRDLFNFIRKERIKLLRHARAEQEEDESRQDQQKVNELEKKIGEINTIVRDINYVKNATNTLNKELKDISYQDEGSQVIFDAGAINMTDFIENLELALCTEGNKIGIGGDGRNNQILLALWKAKSEREHDPEEEVIIYCVEEPEAHLHPHQQRKLAIYLTEKIMGQTIISSHSPQIAAGYRPDSIVRLYEKERSAVAASNGCSKIIEDAWTNFGYRMSVIPAEAFFAKAVFLVEGPSEVLFYQELARQLNIDLDYFNISILMVEGIDFKPFIKILTSMEIPWVLRTDNDILKVPMKDKYRLAGIERCKNVIDITYPNQFEPPRILPDLASDEYTESVMQLKREYSEVINKVGVFLSDIDLENDLIDSAIGGDMKSFAEESRKEGALEFFQKRKATRMAAFLSKHKVSLKKLENDEITRPLMSCLELVKGE